MEGIYASGNLEVQRTEGAWPSRDICLVTHDGDPGAGC